MIASQAIGAGPIPADRTNTELNGFFKAKRWDTLRAAKSVGKIPESLILVGVTGLEPVTLRM